MIEQNEPSMTPPNNPKGVTQFQREELMKWMSKGYLKGKPIGIDNLTREEANTMIIRARQMAAD